MDDLIARLEKATKPDRQSDYELALLFIPKARRRDDPPWLFVPSEMERDQEQVVLAPYYTASIDAALSLLPDTGENEVKLQIRPDHTNAAWLSDTFAEVGFAVPHKTAPLAICVVALKARAALCTQMSK